MPVRNQSWYSRNEARPFPLSDEASGIDDSGARLPNRYLADLHLVFPEAAARRAYLSAVTVTKTLVSVVILGTDKSASPGSFIPLASFSAAKPLDANRQYALSPLYPGVGGWIVFGDAAVQQGSTAEEYAGRFTDPAQSLLAPSTTRSFFSPPIDNVAKLGNATALTGLVQLVGGNDIEIVKECREIPDDPQPLGKEACDPNIATLRDVIVIRLAETVPSGAAGAGQSNVYDVYRGPCAARPESQTCGDPQPIELLASVPPDCCGNITITLKGCAAISKVAETAVVDEMGDIVSIDTTCGVLIDCGLGLSEACVTPDRLPAADGTLPDEVDDLCESITEVSVTITTPPAEEEESFTVLEESESAATDPTLPYSNDFSTQDPNLIVVEGHFSYVSEPPQRWSTEGTNGAAARNVSVLDAEFDTFYKRALTRVEMRLGALGQLHNAAVIANYRETAPGTGLFSYYLAEIDWDGYYEGFKLFRIARFNGVAFNTELAVAVPKLQVNALYEIRLTIYGNANDPNDAWLEARLLSVEDSSVDVTIGPLAINDYAPSLGKFGMASNRAAARFSLFEIDNTSDL